MTTALAALYKESYSHSACAFKGKAFFIIGGADYNHMKPISRVVRYNRETDDFTNFPFLKIARSHAGSCELDGKLYVIAGHDGKDWLGSIERLDVECG